MLLICGDFSGFTLTSFMDQKSDTVALFGAVFSRRTRTRSSSAVEGVRSDEREESKGEFAKLCRRHNIRQ